LNELYATALKRWKQQLEREIEISTHAIEGKRHEFQPLEIINTNRTEYEALWDEDIRKYHYLGCDKDDRSKDKYLILYKNAHIVAISYNRAALRVSVRDTYIGWDEKQKLEKLHQVVNNNRFLILPWVKIKNLASHLLSRTLKLLQKDWCEQYGMLPFLAETFVEYSKYKGTCYLAVSWK